MASPQEATADDGEAAPEPDADAPAEEPMSDEEIQALAKEARREAAERVRAAGEQAADLESDAETLHEAVRARMAEAVELSGTRDGLIRERESVVARRDAASDAARDELQRAQDLLRRVDELRDQADEARERGDLRAAEEAREDAEANEDLARSWTERAARTQAEADQLSDQTTELQESIDQADQAFDEAQAEVVLWEEAADQMDDKAAKLREAVEQYERGMSLQQDLDALNAKMGTDGWDADELGRLANGIAEAVEAEQAALDAAERITIDPRAAESGVLGSDESATPTPGDEATDSQPAADTGDGPLSGVGTSPSATEDVTEPTDGETGTAPVSGVGTSPSITDDVVAPDDGDTGSGPVSGVGTSPPVTEGDAHTARERSPAALRAEADRLEEQVEALGRGKAAEAAQRTELEEKAKLLDRAADLRERSDRLAREAEDLSARGQSAAANQRWNRAEEAHQAAQQTVARADQMAVSPAVEAAVVSGPTRDDRQADPGGPDGGDAGAGQNVTLAEDPFAVEDDVTDAPDSGDAPVDGPDGDELGDGLDLEPDIETDLADADAEPAPLATDPLEEPGAEVGPAPTEIEMEPLEVSVPGSADQQLDTLGPDPGLEPDDTLEPSDDLSDGM